MASIPSNGYREVMAGTNVYTGSNFYGSDCPKTPIVPTDPDDLCNKLYVDTMVGGGSVVSVTGGNNISITGTVPAPIVNLQRPLTASLDVGTQDIISSTSAIDITPLAGQDINVNVSGAGALHAVQTSAGGTTQPIARFNNNNGSAGAVTIRTNKTGRNAATGDVLASLQFNSRNFSAVDTTFAKIECSATTATAGDTDGSIDFYTNISTPNNNQLVFRLNGADNENNSFRPFDLNGNNLKTSTGNLAITTAASTGSGSLDLISKGNTTITSTGAFNATASVSGINLTASGGGTIQNNTTGSFVVAANTTINLLSALGVMNMTNEWHYGKMSTPYTDQVYQSTYQPILTATTNTFPVAEIQREGQQVIFINSAGNGSNELLPISTPNFTITAALRKTSISQTIVGGFNHIQGRCEIRCGGGINDVVTDITSGAFTYIAFPVNSTYYINVLYNSPLYPDTVAVGGLFTAVAGTSYDGGANNYPSDVLNFLCVDATTAVIAPLNMVDSFGRYGVDSEVITISAQSQTYYTLATAPIFILGGKFNNLAGGVGLPASRTAVFCQNGTISPSAFVDRWNGFIDADNTVNKLWVYDDRIVFGGLFNLIGGNTCPYLAFHDNTLTFPNTSLINGFTPPAGINSGFELSSPSSCYVGCLQDPSTFEYPVYQFDLTNMGVTPTIPSNIPASTLPAPATGWLTETGATLDFIVGHDVGTNNYCYKVQTPDFVNLNGATNLQNCFLDTVTVPTPAFFHQASLASTVPTNYYLYVPTSGSVSITTTLALPFVSALSPANNWKTITLASRDNFATGTVVQFGTTDQRIVILASNGASFSN